MIEDLYNKHSVKVISNNIEGSGCLIQPYNADYSYVFTAKHCLTKDHKCKKEYVRIIRDNEETSSISIHEIYLHPELDIAIIKIEKVLELPDPIFYVPLKGESVSIYGYPLLLKGKSEQRQNINCEVSFNRGDHFEITSKSSQFTFEKSTHETTQGFSGSGVYYEREEQLFISGILTRLKANDGAYASLCVVHISLFEELLLKNNLAILSADNFSEIIKDFTIINNVFSISYTLQFAPYYLDREIDRIFLNYLNNPKNIWVSGHSGLGKTLLILRNLNKEKKKPKHIDLTCSQINSINDYFEYINNELITQCNLEETSKKIVVYDRISDNLCQINDQLEEIIIFVDEVPISDKDKFYEFLSGFIGISERYSNLNSLQNKIKWIISTRIDPFIHLKADDTCHPNKLKAQKNFTFKNLDFWTNNELALLLKLLQNSLNFSLSTNTQDQIVKISNGLPGRLKSTIERVLLENCSIGEAIEMVKSENI